MEITQTPHPCNSALSILHSNSRFLYHEGNLITFALLDDMAGEGSDLKIVGGIAGGFTSYTYGLQTPHGGLISRLGMLTGFP